MKTVKDAFDTFKKTLIDLYAPQEVEAITVLVLREITDFSKAKIKAFPETVLNDEQVEQLEAISTRLKTGQPIQYILGHTEFYGLNFAVNPNVLIPRPETEELVNWILESVPSQDVSILDIGTGSGCIAIALKHELKRSTVSAIDISEGALTTAKRNAIDNQTDVNFIRADILAPDAVDLVAKLDIIVSNPPYVTDTDKRQMHSNVTDFEPHTALFVPEENPLLFYNAIADFAGKNLKPNGLLFFEINESYGEATIQLLSDKQFIAIELRKDMSGKDRMVKARLSGIESLPE